MCSPADVSVLDSTKLNGSGTADKVCVAGDVKGVLDGMDNAVVPADFVTCKASSFFDVGAGIFFDDSFVKLVTWYDNKWGYSSRLVE